MIVKGFIVFGTLFSIIIAAPIQFDSEIPKCTKEELKIFWPDYSSKQNYYQCIGIGEPFHLKCGNNKLFDFDKQKCVSEGEWSGYPTKPTESTKPTDPTNPSEPTNPTKTTDPNVPTETTKTPTPTVSTEATATPPTLNPIPTKPTESTGPTKPPRPTPPTPVPTAPTNEPVPTAEPVPTDGPAPDVY